MGNDAKISSKINTQMFIINDEISKINLAIIQTILLSLDRNKLQYQLTISYP